MSQRLTAVRKSSGSESSARFERGIDPDAILLLKPGVKVSLVMNVSGDEKERQAVEDSLKRQIADHGLVLADDQPIKIVAATEAGKTTEREYRLIGFGAFGQTEKATITEQKARLSVEADGKPVWQVDGSTTAGGFHVTVKQGQSVQDAINEASRPNTGFLRSAQVPAYLTKPREPAWYGEAKLPGGK